MSAHHAFPAGTPASGFRDWLTARGAAGPISTDDLVQTILPLARDVAAIHLAGKVVEWNGVESVAEIDGRLRLRGDVAAVAKRNTSQLAAIECAEHGGIELAGEFKAQVLEIDDAHAIVVGPLDEVLPIARFDAEVVRPVYLDQNRNWEDAIGHHDPVTDLFSLGMIFASVACGLDFTDFSALERFVRHRRSLFDLNPGLHPVVAKAIVRMTELERRRRPQEVSALILTLERYREQSVDVEFDLAAIPGFRESPPRDRRQRVLAVLQRRLFELSRRNRLLHFRATAASLNLTWCSIPVSMEAERIRPEDVLTWNDEFARRICTGRPLPLSNLLRMDEAAYVPGTLERIRADARRDQADYGFDPLRLAICFLRWSNLKESPPVSYDTPLALLPARLVKKKGVRDSWQLEPQGTEAEINPVLRHYFKQLYDVALPQAIDLETSSIESLFDFLATRIVASEPGVEIEKIERPRMAVVQAQARRRLEQYLRRTRRDEEREPKNDGDAKESAASPPHSTLDAPGDPSSEPKSEPSNDPELMTTAKPETKATSEESPSEAPAAPIAVAGTPDDASLASASTSPAIAAAGRSFLAPLAGDLSGNPYRWEFDLCSVALGNFRYRKMSLVRDYDELLERAQLHPGFDAIFSLAPRAARPDALETSRTDDSRYPVVSCDPTQSAAVDWAASGESYIIQGPPGTGKSQSITNLIADFVSRGQRVLFVCEKRAAIDVVFHRLKQRGLASLCCLVHDSQSDKKDFILELKQTYEDSLVEPEADATDSPEVARGATLKALRSQLKPLEEFDRAMTEPIAAAGMSARELMLRTLQLRKPDRELPLEHQERLPDSRCWVEHQDDIARLNDRIEDICDDGILSRHPLVSLNSRIAQEERPVEFIRKRLGRALELARRLSVVWSKVFGEAGSTAEWRSAQVVVDTAVSWREAARQKRLALFDADSEMSQTWNVRWPEREERARAVAASQQEASAWKSPLTPADAAVALQRATDWESQTFAFLRPGWWRLRSVLNHRYDFRAHAVRRTWSQALKELSALHAAEARLDEGDAGLRRDFHFEGDVTAFHDSLLRSRAEFLENAAMPAAKARETARALLRRDDGNDAVLELTELETAVPELHRLSLELLEADENISIAGLQEALASIETGLDLWPDFLPALRLLGGLPADFARAARQLPLTPAELEAFAAHRTLETLLREDRSLGKFTAARRTRAVDKIESLHHELFDRNADVVKHRVRQRFRENVRSTNSPAAGAKAEQKAFAKRYSAGRRGLEHEFGKTMRYKSIRDLATGDTGLVIRDLKPIWLMSPLSVSDTLPLDQSEVDVVLFDEASQITLEEAIPAAFRASQMIVVGDEMQLPPTSFFATRSLDEDETIDDANSEATGALESSAEESAARGYELDADSFLTHSSRQLPSVMLGWHYRSRSESLISFSNAAFYQGRLLTVPEEERVAAIRASIASASSAEGESLIDSVFDRPISFHHLADGVYEDRRNRAEAERIAELIRSLLARNAESESPVSVGVIAFSESQQDEISQALERLARQDELFADRLEAEYEREVDGQFSGLLVKNLENIQGDERDVVILSVCYAPDRQGRMRMNFGPINQSGGEKRLNVAFSRAKRHMAIVSSIVAPQITNEHNTGANCLKNYLRYAEARSRGDVDAAARVLRELSPANDPRRRQGLDPVVDQIAEALRAEGFHVDCDVGQSSFRCDLAVFREGDARYRLGVLVDTARHYAARDLIEREVLRPKLLRSFGWEIEHVLTRDWCVDRAAVMKTLLKRLP